MGLETKTIMTRAGQESAGRLHLDSKELAFRGPDAKWSVALGPDVKAQANEGRLTVRCGRDRVDFDLGEAAGKWVEKILHPPSRLDKLGVKTAMRCWVSRGFGSEFKAELKSRAVSFTRSLAKCQLAFLKLQDRDELGALVELAEALPDQTNVWVVWPKSVEQIGQSDVMQAAAKLSLGPSKTAAFDERHSSMRFARRRK